MGLLLGLGFPPFRTGAMKYADTVGLSNIVEKSNKYLELGKMYEPTVGFKAKADAGEKYYNN